MGERVAFQGFVGSAFSAQSPRFDIQELWNWYVERASSPHAKSGQALIPCPGFHKFVELPTPPVRGLFAQDDKAFAVAGTKLYQLTLQGGFIERSPTPIGNPTAPVITVAPTVPALKAPLVPVVIQGDGKEGEPTKATYGYKITALNAFGETQASPEGTTTTGWPVLTTDHWNTISWSAVENADKYKVYRTTGGTEPPRLLVTLAATALVYHDIGQAGTVATPPTTNTTAQAAGTTTYGYKVSATLGMGESAASPEGLTTKGQSRLTSVDYTVVTWTPVVNARGYKVYRTTGGASPPRLIATVVGATVSVRDTGQEGEAAVPPGTGLTGTVEIVDDGTPVTFSTSGDAGEQLFFTSGDFGWCYDFESQLLAPVVQGATAGGFIDSYFVVLDAFTSTLKVSESFDGFTWDPTQVYQRSRAGDKWLAMAVTSNNIWLIGSQTGEVWVGTGDHEARFAPYTPVFIETGVVAADTMIRVSGDTMMWVAQDKDGAGYVVKTNGYSPEKVSTTAVDHSIQNISTINDGLAWSYQQEGHTFYVVSFPAAKTTWVYDLSTNEWHRRGYWNPKFGFDVYRPQCHAFAFGPVGGLGAGLGRNLVGDRFSGIVATMHHSFGRDFRPPGPDTLAEGQVIRRVRQAPHIAAQDKELTFDRLQMDMDVGEGLREGQGSDPTMMLVYSNDGGKTWGHELWRSAGKQGEYRIQVAWSRLGTARHRVFRLVVSDPVPWRIVGAWLEMEGS